MLKILIDSIDNFLEDCKEKEYEVYYKVNMSNGRYEKLLFTKRQLLDFIKKHDVADIQVFKIKDRVKINKIVQLIENKE